MKSMIELTEKAIEVAGELTYERNLKTKSSKTISRLQGQLDLMTWIFEDEPVLLEMIERKIRMQVENNVNPYTGIKELKKEKESV